MQAGARGEARRVAQKLGSTKILISLMQAGTGGEAPRVAQELGMTMIFIPPLVLPQPLGVFAWETQKKNKH